MFGRLKEMGDPRATHLWNSYQKSGDQAVFNRDVAELLKVVSETGPMAPVENVSSGPPQSEQQGGSGGNGPTQRSTSNDDSDKLRRFLNIGSSNNTINSNNPSLQQKQQPPSNINANQDQSQISAPSTPSRANVGVVGQDSPARNKSSINASTSAPPGLPAPPGLGGPGQPQNMEGQSLVDYGNGAVNVAQFPIGEVGFDLQQGMMMQGMPVYHMQEGQYSGQQVYGMQGIPQNIPTQNQQMQQNGVITTASGYAGVMPTYVLGGQMAQMVDGQGGYVQQPYPHGMIVQNSGGQQYQAMPIQGYPQYVQYDAQQVPPLQQQQQGAPEPPTPQQQQQQKEAAAQALIQQREQQAAAVAHAQQRQREREMQPQQQGNQIGGQHAPPSQQQQQGNSGNVRPGFDQRSGAPQMKQQQRQQQHQGMSQQHPGLGRGPVQKQMPVGSTMQQQQSRMHPSQQRQQQQQQQTDTPQKGDSEKKERYK